jgi:hypothetical protein
MWKWGMFKIVSDVELCSHMLTVLRSAVLIHYNFLYHFNKAFYLCVVILLVFPIKA